MTTKIKIEKVLDHLDRELTGALDETIRAHFPNAQFDANRLYRDFVQAAYRRCSRWERVPDNSVEVD